MGKETPDAFPVTNIRQNKSVLKASLLALILAGCLLLSTHYDAFINHEIVAKGDQNCREASANIKGFDWDKLRVSPTLYWVPCYDGFQCARLEVPLDYHDAEAGKAALAMIKYPAKTDRKNEAYKGPILFNPGGPGASGVGIVLNWGNRFKDIVGEDFDLIGFDPRGIGRTTPAVDIFPHSLERESWELRNQDAPLVNQTSSAMAEIMAKSRLLNALVAEKASVAAQHVNTAVVCADMLSIVKAHGMDKLQFWGFSYGTILGSSFAALYPDNVGRMVIDGVADVQSYYQGLWARDLRKADKGLDTAFKQCVEARDECALHESSVDKIRARYLNLVNSLDSKPVTVHANGTLGLVTRKHVHSALFSALYRPYKAMKQLFEALHQLEKGNGLPFWEFANLNEPALHCECGSTLPPPENRGESGTAVLCTDLPPVEDDLDAFHEHFKMLANISYFGDIWSGHKARCVGWKVKPKWDWRGPVTANTSFPILLVGNTEDPVTPDAKLVSKLFKDSVVLTQKSAGHCSVAATSLCTAKAIRAYFQEGKLPDKDTVCEIEDHMFLNRSKYQFTADNQEDAKLLESLRALSGQVRVGEMWFNRP
ncbi:alpha/beta-hydrolase [Serendipita vermifera]|nr:alpha/beta-hydrolase [Serendipita vermifera]